MTSRSWIRQLGGLGLLAFLALASSGVGARPVTGTSSGSGGGGGCVGDDYFCSLGGVESVAACEDITTRDIACFDVMRLVHSDAAARGAQRAFRSASYGTFGGFELAVGTTGEDLRLIGSLVGTDSTVGPRGERLDVEFGPGTGVTLKVYDYFNSPLLMALQTAPDQVSYLLLDGATAFDATGRLSLNLDGLSGPYYGLTLYQGIFAASTSDVPAPGSLLLTALALAAAGAAARRR